MSLFMNWTPVVLGMFLFVCEDDAGVPLPAADQVEKVTAAVYPGPTTDPLLKNIQLKVTDYDHVRNFLSKASPRKTKLREIDKLGVIHIKRKGAENEIAITYYWAGKGAVHFTVSGSESIFVAVDGKRDLGMVISNYIREKAKK